MFQATFNPENIWFIIPAIYIAPPLPGNSHGSMITKATFTASLMLYVNKSIPISHHQLDKTLA